MIFAIFFQKRTKILLPLDKYFVCRHIKCVYYSERYFYVEEVYVKKIYNLSIFSPPAASKVAIFFKQISTLTHYSKICTPPIRLQKLLKILQHILNLIKYIPSQPCHKCGLDSIKCKKSHFWKFLFFFWELRDFLQKILNSDFKFKFMTTRPIYVQKIILLCLLLKILLNSENLHLSKNSNFYLPIRFFQFFVLPRMQNGILFKNVIIYR